ncbi:hypothetical protein [Pseudoalteromonas sp. PS5]|uniref:hypothetical protein n=1 Tax=Pseudoalteromonas sp. PS5 TaxID=1437473 RepID=UPI000FFF594F|nr:hypothetical protein [Pseudoalteromonas sp. PS5]
MSIKYFFLLSTLIISSLARASAGPELEEITPENAEKLGFSVSITIENGTTMLFLVGPKTSVSGCKPHTSGSALIAADETELFVHQSGIEGVDLPVSQGYFTDQNTSMSVWIDYICVPDKSQNNRRYVIHSVSQYIVDQVSQKSHNKAMKDRR